MDRKPTYEELEQRVEALEREAAQRAQLEKQLRLLSLAVEQSREGIAIADLDGNLVYLNNAFAEMYGYSAEELMGTNLSVFHTPEQMPSVEAANLELKQTGSFKGEIWHVRRNGDVFPSLMHNSLVTDETNKPIGMMGTLRDIRDMKQVEAKLRESEEKYRQIFATVSDAIMIFDSETGEFVDINDSCLSMYGYSKDEFLKLRHSDITAEPEESIKSINQVLAGEITRIPLRLHKRKDGAIFPVEISTGTFKLGNRQMLCGLVRNITERKQAEEALKRSERSYQEIFNASNEAIFVHDMETGAVLDVNQTMCEMFGYTHAEAVKLSVGDLSQGEPPYSMDHARQWVRKAVEEGPQRFEWWAKRKNGELFWDETNLKRATIAGQDRILAFVSDITERKLAEEALRVEREQLLSIFNSINEIVYVTDPETYEILYANDYFIEKLKKNPVGGLCYQEFQGLDAPCDFCTNEIILNTKYQPYQWEYHNPILNRDFMLTDRIIRWPDGRDVRFEVAIDITDLREAEKALKESEEKYRNLVESTLDWVWACDVEGRHTFSNRAVKDLLGYEIQEVVGAPAFEFMHIEERQRAQELLKEAVENKRGWKGTVLRWQHKDGSIRHLETRAQPILDGEGNLVGFSGIDRDITKVKLAQEEKAKVQKQLQQAQKMEAIGTLAGGIAHDFNNILAAIIGYTGMMEMFDVPEDSPIRDRIKEVLKAANRAKDLVEQILTFSRQTEQKRKPVQLNYIIKETLRFLRASLPTTIEIRQNIANEEFIALADPTQMHQILMNLCTNAGHAMLETGGRLEVELSSLDLDTQFVKRFPELKPGLHLKLTVSDSGHGMTPEIMERIFDPFFTTKKPGEGTGMGLAVVHGIVKSHEGVITVDSELGKGTVFQIILPRIEMGVVESVGKTAPSMLAGTERILFVDDEQILATLVQEILGRLGYEVVAKTSSREALELFRSQPDRFDLVITDQTMPYMTGIELAREMMQIRSDIPIILCTGYSETATPERVEAADIRELINKPLDPSGLAQTVRKVLDNRIDD